MDIYVDGSCSPSNPGPGGFAFCVVKNNKIIYEYSKRCKWTTNNREELKAIFAGSLYAIENGESAFIFSDSAYAINCLSSWSENWINNNWLKKDGKEPENLDIIKEFYYFYHKYNIKLFKVKGHSGNIANEYVDKLAKGLKVDNL